MDLILTHPAFTAAALIVCTGLGGAMGFILRGWYEEDRRQRARDAAGHGAEPQRLGNEPRRTGSRIGGPVARPGGAGAVPGARDTRGLADAWSPSVPPVGEAARPGVRGWAERGPLVLLVDDRLEILALHSSYLHRHGYEVLTAGDGETALDYARAHSPAVIVLDHSMPRRTGVEVARELKRDPSTREIPILMMTAHSYGAVGMAAKQAGCDRFLSKPVEPSRMLREVEELMSSGRHG